MSQDQFNELVALLEKRFDEFKTEVVKELKTEVVKELKTEVVKELKAELKPQLDSILEATKTLQGYVEQLSIPT